MFLQNIYHLIHPISLWANPMTSIEDLEKQVDAILKRNDEADFENKIIKEYGELISERTKHLFIFICGIVALTIILTALFVYTTTTIDIKTHALAAQNITEYITNLKVV